MDYRDLSVEQAKAIIWTMDVNQEIAAVEALLKQVHTSLSSVAGSEDTIMQGIFNFGTFLESTWTKVCSNFKEAQSAVENTLEKIGVTVGDVLGHLETVRNRAGGR